MEMVYIAFGVWLFGWFLFATEQRPPLDDRRLLKAHFTLEHYKKTGKIRTYFYEGRYDEQD